MSSYRPVINVTRGTVVCEGAALADRPLQRLRGLLGREALPVGEGLLLHPAPSIHTAFMRFPIDVVFLDRESVVVRVIDRLPPWRAAKAQRARSVLELPAGECARCGVQVGDWLVRVSEELVWQDPADDSPSAIVGAAADIRGAADASVHPRLQPEPGRVWRELLLVSHDRRFRAVMAVLLHSRGFTVTFATGLEDRLALARSRAELVVIDVGDSLAAARRAAEETGLSRSDRPVVFVSDEDAPTGAAGVVPKWESLERLCDDIAGTRPPAARPAPHGT
jgi:uncharacterized membrane protein (UPF0127 family)/CheY-like chemotaxis protein